MYCVRFSHVSTVRGTEINYFFCWNSWHICNADAFNAKFFFALENFEAREQLLIVERKSKLVLKLPWHHKF